MPAAGPSIGVLDSGIGGLSVLREIHRALPEHPTLYVADQANLPYGPRPAEEIDRCVESICRFLMQAGATVIVLACHAASAASLLRLRERYPEFPFVGIEPAIKPAVEQTHSGVVGVLTTRATAEGPLYQQGLRRHGSRARVITRIAPELVEIVERGEENSTEAADAVRRHVTPLVDAGADRIVLACTHFPFLATAIQAVAGGGVTLIDPGPAVARQAARVWPATVKPSGPDHRYFTSGDPRAFADRLKRLLGVEADVQTLKTD